MTKTFLGVIGGSGLYDLPGITNLNEVMIETPFGSPSDKIIMGTVDGKNIAFLPRHGKGHRFTPSEVNYRANIFALKKVGVTHILSVSATGSLQEEFPPGSIVIPSQILDRTTGVRQRSFFGNGVVGHVGFADPYCPMFQKRVGEVCKKENKKVHIGGTYVAVEGPRFSTRAESHSFRALNASVIGMTAMPEAILAREAEMPYVTLAFVTDFDCWKENEEAVSVEAVLAVLKENVDTSKRIVKNVLASMPDSEDNPIFGASQWAIMTNPDLIPSKAKQDLDFLFGKYWRK